MKNILILILIIIFIYAFIYFLFFNNAEEAVEDISLATSIENQIFLLKESGIIKDKKMLEIIEKDQNKFLDYCKDKLKININKSIIKILKNNKNIKNIKLTKTDQDKDGEVYVLSCEINNYHFAVPIIALNPSFIKFKRARAAFENPFQALVLYGIDQTELSKMLNDFQGNAFRNLLK